MLSSISWYSTQSCWSSARGVVLDSVVLVIAILFVTVMPNLWCSGQSCWLKQWLTSWPSNLWCSTPSCWSEW
eukprot:8795161-Pyramimonas_sp.AAC.1